MEFELLDKKSWASSKTNKYVTTLCSYNTKINELPEFKSILNKYDHIVVKVGDSHTINKEYEIGRILKSINSFVKYICYFPCNDEFKNLDLNQSINYYKGSENKVLVIQYYSRGSISKFSWDKENFDILKSLIKEIFIALQTAYINFGFIHNDTHLDNFLIGDDNKVIIMDFENSVFDDEKRTNYKILYFGFSQILQELKIKAKLEIINIKDIIEYVNTYERLNKQLDIQTLLLLVDNLKFGTTIVFSYS